MASNDKTKTKSKSVEDEKDDKGTAKDLARVANEASAPYDIGSCIDILSHTFYSKLTEASIAKGQKKDAKKYVETMNKHNVIFYYFSLIVNVCKQDGRLGSKEEAYVRRYGKAWGLPDDKMEETLKGKDCSDDYQKAVSGYWKEIMPNATKEDIERYINAFNNDVVLYAMLAASQDGLLLEEYEAAQKLAAKLGLPKNVVKDNINIIKAEKTLAQMVNGRFMGE